MDKLLRFEKLFIKCNFEVQIYNNHYLFIKVFSKDSKQSIVELDVSDISKNNVKLLLQREELNDVYCMGNKWWKLKYNLQEAIKLGKKQLVTFGGAYSNHILASAWACQKMGLQSVGIIRGDQHLPLNPTLKKAQSFGMNFRYITRDVYRNKEEIDWYSLFPESYLLPEGGTNHLAVKGCKEMLYFNDFDVVCVPVGTGGTMAGIVNGLSTHQQAIGFSSLKNGFFLNETIGKYVGTSQIDWTIESDYHFGGYAKITFKLIEFMNTFKKRYAIQLDPVYTAKMMYGIFDMLKNGQFPSNSIILAIHTGGLQGIEGMNQRIRAKGWCIDY